MSETNKAKDQSALVDALLSSDAGKAMAEQHRATVLKKRQEAAAKVTEIDAFNVAENARLTELTAIALAELQPARQAFDAANFKYQNARNEAGAFAARCDLGKREHTKLLIDTAPAAITEFRRELERLGDKLQGEIKSRDYLGPVNPETGEQPVLRMSNGRSVLARKAAIDQAIRTTLDMQLEALSEEEATARIKALRDGLPAIEAPSLDGNILPGNHATPTPRQSIRGVVARALGA